MFNPEDLDLDLNINSGTYPKFPEKRMTKEDMIKLNRIFDEDEFAELDFVRRLASEKIDFKGFDHINCYNIDNYRNGTLYALEQTRNMISVKTVENIIDYYFILGYSQKRIIYACFEAGFDDVNSTQINRYIKQHRQRLYSEREKLMRQLDQVTNGVFQNMKAQVMAEEKRTLDILLEKQQKLNEELDVLDPIKNQKAFTTTMELIDNIQKKINAMNGIEGLRKVSIDVARIQKAEEIKRAVGQGWMDDELKDVIDKKKAALAGGKEESGSGKVIDANATIVLE